MKKIITLSLLSALAIFTVGCSRPSTPVQAIDDTYEIALITDTSSIDDKAFNQGSWEGLKQFAEEKKLTYKYYKPKNNATDEYLDTIGLAVKGGAKIIIAPGYLFEQAIYAAQDTYPDTKFVILDATPCNADYTDYKIADNTYSITYAEDQAGFLAGYAAVKDGYRQLGFLGGMAMPNVVNFGYGYIQGADYAAKELGLQKGDVTVNFAYLNSFEPSPENQTFAASWYQGGTELIFSAAGGAGASVMAAAESTGKKMIGVDIDQSTESETIITSSMKGLSTSVYQALELYANNAFPGGTSKVLDASSNGVSLSMETARFQSFSQADYDVIFKALGENTNSLSSTILKDIDCSSPSQLPTTVVSVVEIQ